jgi:pimeloyl-ACP methyl ester carboxylesterase
MTAPDSKPGFDAMTPAETRWENRVAGRIAVRVTGYRPGRAAAKIACPVLFCVCDGDTITPARRTLKFAAAAPRGEIKRYPIGHFDIYVGEPFERAVADQTEFLVRHLSPAASATVVPLPGAGTGDRPAGSVSRQ